MLLVYEDLEIGWLCSLILAFAAALCEERKDVDIHRRVLYVKTMRWEEFFLEEKMTHYSRHLRVRKLQPEHLDTPLQEI
jgi:hypothetical protein